MPGPLCICALSLGRCPRQGSCWPCVRLHSVACILYPALSCTRALFCLRATCTPPTPFCKSHVHPCPFWREPRAPYPHLSAKAMCTHALFGESHVHPTHTFLQKPCTPMPFLARATCTLPTPFCQSHVHPCPFWREPRAPYPHLSAKAMYTHALSQKPSIPAPFTHGTLPTRQDAVWRTSSCQSALEAPPLAQVPRAGPRAAVCPRHTPLWPEVSKPPHAPPWTVVHGPLMHCGP